MINDMLSDIGIDGIYVVREKYGYEIHEKKDQRLFQSVYIY